MTHKTVKNDGYTRSTLADIAKEMAKPRLAESVREAAEIAEQEANRVRSVHGPKKKKWKLMPDHVQTGTMMVYQSANLEPFALQGEPYFRNWHSLGIAESSALDNKVRREGWSLFFMAGEIRALVPSWGGHNSLRTGLKRLLSQTHLQYFNCLEVTDIRRKRFFGIPYVCISANQRHIQRGSQIESIEQRSEHEATKDQWPTH